MVESKRDVPVTRTALLLGVATLLVGACLVGAVVFVLGAASVDTAPVSRSLFPDFSFYDRTLPISLSTIAVGACYVRAGWAAGMRGLRTSGVRMCGVVSLVLVGLLAFGLFDGDLFVWRFFKELRVATERAPVIALVLALHGLFAAAFGAPEVEPETAVRRTRLGC